MAKVHFIGIGGIGMSALARYCLANGWKVGGSDLNASEITDNLQKAGVVFFVGHNAGNIPDDADRIIYSSAVRSGNPEIIRAKDLKIPLLSYAQALGELTKQYITIAVSGSHGKSTTTALLALMMIKGGLDPTVIIGTRLKEFGGVNFRLGKSRYLVIEADEWANSFHNYYPAVAVITNIDKEHLDTFGNLRGVIKGFNRYLINNVGKKGKIIINANDKNSLAATKNCKANIIYFNSKFKIQNSKLRNWPLKIPGKYNQLNAEMAWQAARLAGVKKKDALAAVKNYNGSWRRLEPLAPISANLPTKIIKGYFFSDYAHHPTEIQATGSALRQKYPNKKITLIYQPHQVERLNNLFNDFIKSFKDFNDVGILPAYDVAGREKINTSERSGKSKTSKDLAIKVKAKYLNNFEEALTLIGELHKSRPVVVFMGAGDIDSKVRKYFKSKLL